MRAKQFTSTSFSRYSEYKLCPLKAKLHHLDKIQEPKNAAMQRGADIHDQARDYIKGVLKKLPAELKLVKTYLDELKKLAKKRLLGTIIEEDWAFTSDWTRTQWNDWANCVLRVKLDAAHYEADHILVVTDWKTGKFRAEFHEEYLEQLELYALAAFMIHDHVMEVKPRLVYTDLNVTYPPAGKPLVFKRNQVMKLKALWAKRFRPMLNDTTFAPRPNDKCKWCFYGQSGKIKGGPGLCRF
jgi:CRISPR/Cas system-associated exonuclease Cas4 (RecB family)